MLIEDAVPPSALAAAQQAYERTIERAMEVGHGAAAEFDAPSPTEGPYRFQDPHHPAVMETALVEVEDLIASMRAEGSLPAEVMVDYSGTAGDLEIAKDQFFWVLVLALLISYLLMSALFEDFLAPIVVLVTLPLAAAGGVGGLRLVDAFLAPQPLDLMTALGFLILIGVVVNNAILVVDGALARLGEGADLEESIRDSVAGRVRPILMTTATSLAGLLPMVLFPGSGSELYRGVGAVVLGGLTLATALTLFVVPSLFALIWRLRLPPERR